MTNFGARILSNAISGLQASQAKIAVTGTNIANVNTPGYSRRSVEVQTRSGSSSDKVSVGNGVEIGNVRRINDQFIDRALRNAIAQSSGYTMESSILQRMQGLFTITGDSQTVGTTLNGFFTAMQDLAVNPASIELRSNFVSKTQDLISSIRTTFSALANLQEEADNRVRAEVGVLNGITSQIAALNSAISGIEGPGITAADERDRRDQLLNQLAEKVSYQLVEQDDGQVNIFLSNGFPLVAGGTARPLAVTQSPSFASGSLPPSLSGGVLNSIVFDYGTSGTPAHVDLTSVIGRGDGEIGALLRVRGINDPGNSSAFEASGPLVEIASRIEGITRTLLTTINQAYRGPDRDGDFSPPAGDLDPTAGDLDGNTPAVYGLFDFEQSGATPPAKDVNGNGAPDDITSPVLGIDNYSSRLIIAFTDPRRVAAARDSSGAVSGAMVFNPGDGRNIESLAQLRTQSHLFTAGNFSLNATFDEAYNESVTRVGALGAAAVNNERLAESQTNAVQARRDQIASVSLDEEFTQLIQSQRAFQASARLIKIADDLLAQVVQLI